MSVDPPDIQRMQRLTEAYGLGEGADLGVIRDAIVDEDNDIIGASNDNQAVLVLLGTLLTRDGAFEALGAAGRPSGELVLDLAGEAAKSKPMLPPEDLVRQTLASIQSALDHSRPS